MLEDKFEVQDKNGIREIQPVTRHLVQNVKSRNYLDQLVDNWLLLCY